MKYSLNIKDFSDQETDLNSFCFKTALQSAGGALEKGQES